MKQKILAMLVIIMFAAMILPTVLAEPTFLNSLENKKTCISAALGKNDEYIPHEPISIIGDTEFTAEQGVTGGSGTETDPFIIENWNVSSIHVESTTRFFVINHCYICSYFAAGGAVGFRDVLNGKVKDCTILKYGIGDGIGLVGSNSNSIEDCSISGLNDLGSGIDLSDSSYNTIYRCDIKQCYYAIYLSGRSGSHNNIIYCCNISDCLGGGGIRLSVSKNNKIYHNNFLDNYFTLSKSFKIRCNAESMGGINQWDDGIEGNYWDNYRGLRFPRLYDLDNDGIGELPYRILTAPLPWGLLGGPSGNKDRHPLIKPYNEN